MNENRIETLKILDEAVASGCRFGIACCELGISARTVQRWRKLEEGGHDGRRGPLTAPGNKLSDAERAEVLRLATSPAFRNVSPKQIVPRLADQGTYVASESTFYRILDEAGLAAPRGSTRPRNHVRPAELLATGPNQVWSWDITYVPSTVKGRFFYLYLFVDVWSRCIMKAVVREEENAELAAELIAEACREHRIEPDTLVLHSDNGGPMKGATMLATLQNLGVVPSFSRPSVSDDNPFSESLFRTVKCSPSYPKRFASVDAAWAWVERFVTWYNDEHLHSGIGFVTPNARHRSEDVDVLEARREVYESARERNPARWARTTRQWDAPAVVALNPRTPETKARARRELRVGAPGTTSTAPSTTSPSTSTPQRRRTEKSIAV